MNLQLITSLIMNKLPEAPKFAIILGSGLGGIVNNMEKTISIQYRDIPKYPCSNILGHAGKWIFGYVNNKPIICASGRCHYYEGYSMQGITLPVSIAHSLGVHSLFISNAAGCLTKEWEIGDLMLITGYLDYSFRENSNRPVIVPFDMVSEKQNIARKIATNRGILLREGIYTWTIGPSYETLVEIQDIISLGGNAVGMSTVPEMMKAHELELDVIGISCLTNYGAGMYGAKLSHKDVLETSSQMQNIFSKLLFEII